MSRFRKRVEVLTPHTELASFLGREGRRKTYSPPPHPNVLRERKEGEGCPDPLFQTEGGELLQPPGAFAGGTFFAAQKAAGKKLVKIMEMKQDFCQRNILYCRPNEFT